MGENAATTSHLGKEKHGKIGSRWMGHTTQDFQPGDRRVTENVNFITPPPIFSLKLIESMSRPSACRSDSNGDLKRQSQRQRHLTVLYWCFHWYYVSV